MIKRTDIATAFKVDLAVDMAATRGVLFAARFLDRQQVPTGVSLRALGETSGGRREPAQDTDPA
ncbi:hypothetical protein [Massilia yuzhufengensis]|uniref:hypothetical protein n=1 Tax=Massilia yuzhufengensis TaxID=1164594 RepID=UPI0011607EA5|nr:hypothetical protein [Massilia yuzhufengensis]